MPGHFQITYQDYNVKGQLPLRIVYKATGTSNERIFHAHDFSEIAIMISGTVLHVADSKSTILKKGDIIVIHPGTIHGYDKTNTLELVNIMYDPKRLPLPLMADGYRHPLFHLLFPDKNTTPPVSPEHPIINVPENKLNDIIALINNIDAELKGDNPCAKFYVLALFMEFITLLIRVSNEPLSRHKEEQAMDEILGFLNSNYRNHIPIPKLARLVSMSERNFFRQFKNSVGCSPADYLIKIRLQRAAELLTGTDLPITDIAAKCGFPDSSYFASKFKKILSTSPRTFREQAQKSSRK